MLCLNMNLNSAPQLPEETPEALGFYLFSWIKFQLDSILQSRKQRIEINRTVKRIVDSWQNGGVRNLRSSDAAPERAFFVDEVRRRVSEILGFDKEYHFGILVPQPSSEAAIEESLKKRIEFFSGNNNLLRHIERKTRQGTLEAAFKYIKERFRKFDNLQSPIIKEAFQTQVRLTSPERPSPLRGVSKPQ